jgi:hypothetical protein
MASASEISLQSAVSAVERAIARLDAAVDVAAVERANIAAGAESAQAEITKSWQTHAAELESALSAMKSENDYLLEENSRMANQLQLLQQDYVSLQEEAENAVVRLDATVKQLDLVLEH